MDLSKIETLIAFVGRSNISELTVTDKGTTVRIIRDKPQDAPVSNTSPGVFDVQSKPDQALDGSSQAGFIVSAPIFGVLHLSPAPDEAPLVAVGDDVVEGQTLFIIEAMKVFNKIAAPRAGRITRMTDVNGTEVEAGDMLAEIA